MPVTSNFPFPTMLSTISNTENTANPLADEKVLDWPKLKQITDILKCIQNGK